MFGKAKKGSKDMLTQCCADIIHHKLDQIAVDNALISSKCKQIKNHIHTNTKLDEQTLKDIDDLLEEIEKNSSDISDNVQYLNR